MLAKHRHARRIHLFQRRIGKRQHDVQIVNHHVHDNADIQRANFKKWDESRLADIFAMIENIDQNVGRLRAHLTERGVAGETLFVFLCDNGPTGGGRTVPRYRAGTVRPKPLEGAYRHR